MLQNGINNTGSFWFLKAINPYGICKTNVAFWFDDHHQYWLPAAPVGPACEGILQFSRLKFVMPQIPSSACQNVNSGAEATPHLSRMSCQHHSPPHPTTATTTTTACNQLDHKYFITFSKGSCGRWLCAGCTLAAAFWPCPLHIWNAFSTCQLK